MPVAYAHPGADEDVLWPEKSQQDRTDAPVSEHVQCVYAHRWQVPREVWWDLFNSAEQEIGILGYSALFLADDAGIVELLAPSARNGVKVQILVGSPDSPTVKQRGEEEGIGDALVARACNALTLLRPLMSIEGVEVRTHPTILYNSIYLTENRLLVNQHIYGLPAAKAPVVEIDRATSPGTADTYVRSFALTWENAHSTTC